MEFLSFALTPEALSLQAQTQAGARLVFTRAELTRFGGEPEETGMPLELIAVRATGGYQATLTLRIDNGGMDEGFAVGGVKVWADDPTVGEILYGVAEAGAHPGWIPPYQSGPLELVYDIVMAISDEAEMTIIDDKSRVYVAWPAFEDAMGKQRHVAAAIDESNGETTEEAQRRQDAVLESLAQGQGMASVERSFQPHAVALWHIEEGILDGDKLTTGGEA